MFPLTKILNFGFHIENPHYDIIKSAIFFNILITFLLIPHSYLNLFINRNYTFGSIEIIILFILLGLIVVHKKYKQEKTFLLLTTIALFVLSLAYYISCKQTIYSTIWLCFFPLIVFLLNGLKIGKIFSGIYILSIALYSYFDTGIYTNTRELFQLILGLTLFSILVCIFEKSRKNAFLKMTEAMNELQRISYLDELTQLYNRHYLHNEILHSTKLQQYKSLLFCITDIDNFKSYNDNYGHQKGDETLQLIASLQKKSIESVQNNFVLRLGGEEFGAFIFDAPNPKQYIEDFLRALESLEILHSKNTPFAICTVSIGAAYCNDLRKFNFETLYKLADDALYEAKRNGKNRVIYKTI
ncbi:GGDEF domain-containing protein [Sulfurimonas sp.]